MAPGYAELRSQARTLVAHGVPRDLHQHFLAALQQVGDLPCLAAPPLGRRHLVDIEEPVALQPDVDEGGVHAGQYVLHPAFVDVPHQRPASGPLHVQLDRPAFFQQRHSGLEGVARDHELPHRRPGVHERWTSIRSIFSILRPIPASRPSASTTRSGRAVPSGVIAARKANVHESPGPALTETAST